MAEIDVQRRSGLGWLWVLLGVIILGAIIWAVMDDDDDELTSDPVFEVPAVVEVAPPLIPLPDSLVGMTGGIPVSSILGDPEEWTGRTVSGEVRVVEVPTDRGFWIEDQGQRLFAVLVDQPQEAPVDVNEGQTVRIDNATIRDAAMTSDIPGAEVDADTRRILEDQQVFLLVDEDSLQILAGATQNP